MIGGRYSVVSNIDIILTTGIQSNAGEDAFKLQDRVAVHNRFLLIFNSTSPLPSRFRKVHLIQEKSMAIMLKSRQEIAHLREAGRIVAETYEVLRPYIVPGMNTAELDRIAEEFIRSKGAIPVYKGYGARPQRNGYPAVPPFPATICTAINHVICHGIPNPQHVLKDGDIIGTDIGVRYSGWVGDSCA